MRPLQLILVVAFLISGCGDETMLLASDWSPRHLAIDATNAYWFVEAPSASIKAVPLGEGTPTIVATLPAAASGAKLDGSMLYYGTCGAVMQLSVLGGANPQPVITIPACVKDITTDEGSIYWSNMSGTIYRVSKSGGTAVSIFMGSNITCLIADRSGLYWADASQGVMTAQPDAAPVVLAPVQTTSCSLALDTDYLYWVDFSNDVVSRIPKAGGDRLTIASGQIHPNSVAVDEAFVYWTTSGRYDDFKEDYFDGAVWRARKDSSNQPHQIASKSNPHGIALDSKYIYWATWPHYTLGGIFKKPH